MKIRITGIVSTPTSAVSLYRSVGVFPRLREHFPSIVFRWRDRIDWRHLVDTDILYVQRPMYDHDQDAIRLAKQLGIPIWLDFDDLVTDVPESNPRHAIFANPKVKRVIDSCLRMADVITVTTESLRDDLGLQIGNRSKIHLVPNALNDRWFKLNIEKNPERSNTVVWRGGQSHDQDLMEYQAEIAHLTYQFPSTEFVFMGNPFWGAVKACNPENTRIMPAQDVLSYFQILKALAPKLVIVPLADHPFNRCKSNIAWLEATYAGALTLGPSWREWARPGLLSYKDKDEFAKQAAWVIKEENPLDEFTADLFYASKAFVMENLTLEEVNRQRVQIVRSLLGY